MGMETITFMRLLQNREYTISEMYQYGYTDLRCIPLNGKEALRLFDEGYEVWRIYPDCTEGIVTTATEVIEHEDSGGMFGTYIGGVFDGMRKQHTSKPDGHSLLIRLGYKQIDEKLEGIKEAWKSNYNEQVIHFLKNGGIYFVGKGNYKLMDAISERSWELSFDREHEWWKYYHSSSEDEPS